MLQAVLDDIHVPRVDPGRGRPRPDAVLADRGYATTVIRRDLRKRGIVAVIPEERDSIAALKRKGSTGGRPPVFDAPAYKGRNVIKRAFALAKQWRGPATRHDKLAAVYRGAIVV
ncbi:transposase [Corynebacterium guangdongense]|uniref:transposase n=1 Tax=Corynebacterium guangdongense TaxID=1783348 RepID=UPI00338DBCAF